MWVTTRQRIKLYQSTFGWWQFLLLSSRFEILLSVEVWKNLEWSPWLKQWSLKCRSYYKTLKLQTKQHLILIIYITFYRLAHESFFIADMSKYCMEFNIGSRPSMNFFFQTTIVSVIFHSEAIFHFYLAKNLPEELKLFWVYDRVASFLHALNYFVQRNCNFLHQSLVFRSIAFKFRIPGNF